MKHAITLVLMLGACTAMARPSYVAPLTDSNVATNGAAITTNETPINITAWVDAVKIDFSGNTSGATCDVDIVTSPARATGASRTILSVDDVDVNGQQSYFLNVRDIADTTAGAAIANEPVCIPLVNDRVQVWLSGANQTGVVAKTWIFVKR